MGVRIDQFDVPVCNSFQDTILNDQLCYEVDLKRFANKTNIDRDLKLGLNILMDYNEDRQVTFEKDISESIKVGLTNNLVESDQDQHALIYINTIGEPSCFENQESN